MEANQVSHTDEWIRKNMIYPYNGILFSLETEGDSGFPEFFYFFPGSLDPMDRGA